MTTSLFKVARPSSGSTARTSVAAGPSSSTYFAEGSDSANNANIARVNSDGSVNWQKQITISGASSTYGITPNIASSTDHVAVVLRHDNSGSATFTTVVVLYDSSGTLIWQKTVPLTILAPAIITTGFPADYGIGGLALAEDESVYLTGTVSSDASTLLAKLAGADGSLSWVVNLNPSTDAVTDDNSGPLALLSGGDVIAAIIGPDIGTGERAHVQRIAASDGSIVWTRSLSWVSGYAQTGLAVDPSDNVFVVGAAWDFSAYEIPVIKLDSSGTSLWSRKVVQAGSSYTLDVAQRLAADATGVYIPVEVVGTRRVGQIFVPTAGTVATGTAKAGFYTTLYASPAFEVRGGGIAGSQGLLVFSDRISGSDPIYAVVARSDSTTTGDDTGYGPYTRASLSYNVATSTAAAASSTYTRASTPSLTLTSDSITSGSGTNVVTAYTVATNATATGIASTLAFGSAFVLGIQLPYTSSTVFGVADARNRGLYATGKASGLAFGSAEGKLTYPATGIASTVTFGTAAYDPTSIKTATGIASTAALGEPRSIRGVAPAPIGFVSSDAPATTFGTPSIALVANLGATGFSTTTFGTASSTYGLAASALAAATTFGAAKVRLPLDATAITTTLFGTPVLRALGYPTGFNATRVGTPTLRNKLNGAVTGFTATVFGTPTTRGQSRTRGAKFRTQFGTPQAERTTP